MPENRDPAIKLFGKTIQIPVGLEVSVTIGKEFIGHDKIPSNKDDESNNSTNEEKIDQESSPENSNDELDESSNNPPNKSNKKPDKILPCPRCKSMDTKFCYYNNYNVNQPRHFCKCCQRYWTAGGSMRNVPVGAGRRKSKSSTSNQHLHHITIPNSVQSSSQSTQHFQPLKSNGTVLSFGSESPLCESMSSVMKLMDKTVKNPNQNEPMKVSTNQNWPYQWTHPPFALPFYPITAYWTAPWLCPPPTNSANLGKHSREGNLLNHNQLDKGIASTPQKCLWVPKTMRADAPEKMQGVKCLQPWDSRMTKTDLRSGGRGLFKAFQSKGDHKILSTEVSQAMLANPAALSRSFTFQESS